MVIEAAKGGHTNVVQMLIDFPVSEDMATPGHDNRLPSATLSDSGNVPTGGNLSYH